MIKNIIKTRGKAWLKRYGMRWLAGWSDRLAAVAWAVILFQIAYWLGHETFQGYSWYAETRTVVLRTLIVGGLAEVLLPWRKSIRIVLQLVVILWVHSAVLHYEPVWHGEQAPIRNVLDNVQPFLPYIWYSLAFWCAYQFVLAWARSKLRVIGLVLTAILSFAIADSTRQLYLWEETAFVVCAGLVLVILTHYDDFRKRNPQAWQYIKDYPGTIAMPAIIVITVTILAGTAAPEARPLLTDPYTAWQSWRGNEVSKIGKKPVSTASVTRTAANASSGYGRDDSVLGSGFDYDYSEVMRIVTDRRSYWRGESKHVYTGEGWESIPSDFVPVPLQTPLDSSPVKGDYVEVRQTISVSSEHPYPVLFGAMSLAVVEQVDGQTEGTISELAWSSTDAALLFHGLPEEYPQTYTLISHVPIIDSDQLRQAGPPSEDMSAYTALPASLPERVKVLAEQVTAEANNDYDRAKAVEAYLRETFPYTNQPDTSKGTSPDFVDRFLFEIQEGYCDYYSTAMAVMLRSLNIPTRWVKGYTAGANQQEIYGFQDAIRRYTDTIGAGQYIVRNADAHSWVEVYFEGQGWIPFEPTATYFMPTVDPVEETAPTYELSESDATEIPTSEDAVWDRRLTMSGWIVGTLLLIALLLYVLYRKGKLASTGRFLLRSIHRKPKSYEEQVIFAFEALLKHGRKRGYSRRESETAREAIARWSASNSELEADWKTVLELFEQAKYSQRAIQEQDVKRMEQLLEQLKKAM